MIRAYQALQYNWFPQGQQRKVKTYGKHEGATLFGAINYETGPRSSSWRRKGECGRMDSLFKRSVGCVSPWKNRHEFGQQSNPSRNGSLAFSSRTPTVAACVSSALQSWINLMEGVWKWLKSDVIHNVFFSKFYRIRLHVTAFMNRLNKHPQQTIDRLLVRL